LFYEIIRLIGSALGKQHVDFKNSMLKIMEVNSF